MLARAYGSVGTKGSLVQEWGAEELTGNLASVGNDRGGAIAISNALDRVQRVQVGSERHILYPVLDSYDSVSLDIYLRTRRAGFLREIKRGQAAPA